MSIGSAPSPVKVALVTGASRGIGRAAAHSLGRRGYAVAIAARTLDAEPGGPDGLHEAAFALSAEGIQVLPVPLDLGDLGSIEQAVDRVLGEWGRVDALVNNAIAVFPASVQRVAEADPHDLERVLAVNVAGPVRLIQAVLPGMRERGEGVIVNVLSEVANMDPSGPVEAGGWGFGYAAVKAALQRLSGVLQVEEGPWGLRAYGFMPGSVWTDSVRAAYPTPEAAQAARDLYAFLEPEVPGAAIAWMVDDPAAAEAAGGVLDVREMMERPDIDLSEG
jgi:hypothetical protein